MANEKSHSRAETQTTMTISLSRELLAKIDQLAAQDDRSRSKWVVRELRKIVAQKISEKKPVIAAPSRLTAPLSEEAQRLNEPSADPGPTPRATPSRIREALRKRKP